MPFLLLAASIKALWLPRPRLLRAYLFSASLVLALALGVVSAAGLSALAVAAIGLYLLQRAGRAPPPRRSR